MLATFLLTFLILQHSEASFSKRKNGFLQDKGKFTPDIDFYVYDEEFMTVDGISHSMDTLNPTPWSSQNGTDILGNYKVDQQEGNLDDIFFKISLRTYESGNLYVFRQEIGRSGSLDPIEGTNVGSGPESYNSVGTSFPTLAPYGVRDSRVGVMSFGGNMGGWAALAVAELPPSSSGLKTPIRNGELGGPIVFFNEDASQVLILSPLNNFMTSNVVVRWHFDEDLNVTLPLIDSGLMGSVETIPSPGLQLEFVLVLGSSFDEAFHLWGKTLLDYHGKSENSDLITSKFLGYWTDNGAFYYYNTADGLPSYEETLFNLNEYFVMNEIPIQHFEIDSWWYYKGKLQGVTNWTELPDVFPNGLSYIKDQIGWPIVAHNRYWSKDNVYAIQNGGEFDFFMEESGSLPHDQNFWNYLFEEASKWGLKVYEQDWLDVQYRLGRITHTDLNAARTWLIQMGRGAELNDIDLTYCMALPREILQSSEIQRVKSARVSGDYILSKDQWRVGLSTYLSSALGLAPFKDVLWTSESNPGNPFYYDCMIVSNNTNPNIPWTLNYRYNGYKHQSKSGKPCIKWYDLDLHWTQPNGDLERDACRTLANSPWGEGKPFCFVNASLDVDPSLWVWEECDIPVCSVDCIRDGVDPEDINLSSCEEVVEPNPELEVVVSVLTRGGVGIGDKIGYIDTSLLMMTCTKDGYLLRPDKPARATPFQITSMAFSPDHKPQRPHSEMGIGEVWKTETILRNTDTFHMIFVAETKSKDISLKSLGIEGPDSSENFAVSRLISLHDQNVTMEVLNPEEGFLTLPNLNEKEFQLIFLSPIWKIGGVEVTLIGEITKIVRVSNDRIVGMDLQENSITLTLQGSFFEPVSMMWWIPNGSETTHVSNCTIPETGLVALRFDVKSISTSCLAF